MHTKIKLKTWENWEKWENSIKVNKLKNQTRNKQKPFIIIAGDWKIIFEWTKAKKSKQNWFFLQIFAQHCLILLIYCFTDQWISISIKFNKTSFSCCSFHFFFYKIVTFITMYFYNDEKCFIYMENVSERKNVKSDLFIQ